MRSPRLPQVLQETLHRFSFLWTQWAKPSLVVDEYDSCSLKVDNHIGLMIAVDIDEAKESLKNNFRSSHQGW